MTNTPLSHLICIVVPLSTTHSSAFTPFCGPVQKQKASGSSSSDNVFIRRLSRGRLLTVVFRPAPSSMAQCCLVMLLGQFGTVTTEMPTAASRSHNSLIFNKCFSALSLSAILAPKYLCTRESFDAAVLFSYCLSNRSQIAQAIPLQET